MSDFDTDPPQTSTAWPPPPSSQSDDVLTFYSKATTLTPQNVGILIVYNILTLGFYPYFWLKRVNGQIAQISPRDALSKGAVDVIFLSGLATLFGRIFEKRLIENPLWWILYFLFTIGLLAACIVTMFKVRDAINRVLDLKGPDRISAVWTFIFWHLHIQDRINTLNKKALALVGAG
jgi:hypothetical protein